MTGCFCCVILSAREALAAGGEEDAAAERRDARGGRVEVADPVPAIAVALAHPNSGTPDSVVEASA